MSSDRQRAKLKSRKTTEDDLVLPQSLFFGRRGQRESTPANANNSVSCEKSIKELGIFRYFDELEPKSARIFTSHEKTIRVSEILKMYPMLRYFLSLTLKLVSNHLHISSSIMIRRQPQQGNADRVLVKMIILTQRLSRGDQSFPQYFYNVILHVYS